MKRFAMAILALIFALVLTESLIGCAGLPSATPVAEEKTSPPAPGAAAPREVVGLASGMVTELGQDIAFLKGVSDKGNLVVGVWEDRQKPLAGPELYLYEIASRELTCLVGPSDMALSIGYVSLSDCWLLWEEALPTPEGRGWKLHLKNLETGHDDVLAQDDLGALDSATFTNFAPRPSISGAYVVWRQFTRNGETFDSQILLYDLRSKVKRPVARIERGGLDCVVQSPHVYGNLIAWNRVVYDRANRVARADVYLLNLETGKERKLTENGASFAPVISGNYVAWQYRNTPEGVYGEIEVYDLLTDTLTRITRGGPYDEFWGPSIGSKVVTWHPSSAKKAEAYDLDARKLLLLDEGYITRVLTNGNVVAWEWNEPKDRIDPLGRRVRFVLFTGNS